MDVPEFFAKAFQRFASTLWSGAASQNPIINCGLTKPGALSRVSGDCVDLSSIETYPFSKSHIECGVVAVHHKMRAHNSAPEPEPIQDLRNLAVHRMLAHQIHGELASESLLHGFHCELDLADVGFV